MGSDPMDEVRGEAWLWGEFGSNCLASTEALTTTACFNSAISSALRGLGHTHLGRPNSRREMKAERASSLHALRPLPRT